MDKKTNELLTKVLKGSTPPSLLAFCVRNWTSELADFLANYPDSFESFARSVQEDHKKERATKKLKEEQATKKEQATNKLRDVDPDLLQSILGRIDAETVELILTFDGTDMAERVRKKFAPKTELFPSDEASKTFDTCNPDLIALRSFTYNLLRMADDEFLELGYDLAHVRRAYTLTWFFVIDGRFLRRYQSLIQSGVGGPLTMTCPSFIQKTTKIPQTKSLREIQRLLKSSKYSCPLSKSILEYKTKKSDAIDSKSLSYHRALEPIIRFRHTITATPEEQIRSLWAKIIDAFYCSSLDTSVVSTLEYDVTRVFKTFKHKRRVDIAAGVNGCPLYLFLCEVAATEMGDYDHKDYMKLICEMNMILFALISKFQSMPEVLEVCIYIS